MSERRRLDVLVVERGLAPNRERARRLIMAGDVLVDDRPVTKAGQQVDTAAVLRVRSVPAPYVSRGGEKLAGALAAFALDVRGRLALDVGASTGGFTDCLLRHGVARVVALDVGYGQMAWSLRQDERVTVLDRVNVRAVEPSALPFVPTLATIDVSFISLALVLPAVARVVASGADVLALVKPQFEVGRERVGSGGVVRDPALRAEAVAAVRAAAVAAGYVVRGEAESVLPGPKGNRETFLWLVAAVP
ncbi:MAG TPA: TlyA family RNA methyltransferase [Vicinamibacterales bacterium]|nr:TlyA family RNA methyltransferase [Vicinamibacterales bacterium]